MEYAVAYTTPIHLDYLLWPTKVIGADPTMSYSYLPSYDLSNIVKVDYDFLPDTTHLMQVEQPEKCVTTMCEFFASIGFV